jgi:hypothetical protein
MNRGLPSHKTGTKLVFLKDDLVKWTKEHYTRHLMEGGTNYDYYNSFSYSNGHSGMVTSSWKEYDKTS